jgi:hypothetical protein
MTQEILGVVAGPEALTQTDTSEVGPLARPDTSGVRPRDVSVVEDARRH